MTTHTTRLVLIDSRVNDLDTVVRSLLADTKYVVVEFEIDTLETIQAKIDLLGPLSFESVAIFQENYEMATYQFVQSFGQAVLENVAEVDGQLASWAQFSGLLSYFKNSLKALNIDLLGCNIYSNQNWRFVIDKLSTDLGISIQSSNDETGNENLGGNWILESNNSNLIGSYFSEYIKQYKGTLDSLIVFAQIGNNIVGQNNNDQFGSCISMSDDGKTVAIGAPQTDVNYNNSGSVSVYFFNGTSWAQVGQTINGITNFNADYGGDKFGSSVSMSVDGLTVAIGAPGSQNNYGWLGSAEIWKYNGTSWQQLGQTLIGVDVCNPLWVPRNAFGYSISLSSDGNTVAVGAPQCSKPGWGWSMGQAHIFKYNSLSNTWTDNFPQIWGGGEEQAGQSISLSGDGNTVVIGNFGNIDNYTPEGRVLIYRYISNEWIKILDMLGPWLSGDRWGWGSGQFGSFISISKDGTTAALGAIRIRDTLERRVEVYRCSQSDPFTWTQMGSTLYGGTNLYASMSNVSLSSNGNSMIFGKNIYNYGNNNEWELYTQIPDNGGTFISATSDLQNFAMGSPTFNNSTGKVNAYSIVLQTVPDAPTDLVATPNDTQISIAFTDPSSNGGSAITNYAYSSDGTNFTLFSPAITTSPTIIDGLTNGQPYTIYLRAINAIGQGPSSTSVTSTPLPIHLAPSATGSATLSAILEDNTNPSGSPISSLFSSNFSSSTSNTLAGIAITSYTSNSSNGSWQYSSNSGSSWTTLSSVTSDTSAFCLLYTDYLRFLPALDWNGTAPTLTVVLIDDYVTVTRAAIIDVNTINRGGSTAYSSASVILSHTVTAVNDVPSAPSITSTSTSNRQISIEFTGPTNYDGTEVLRYEYSTSSTFATYDTFASTASPLDISGLTNGQSYTYYLRAVNAAGQGASSSAITKYLPNAGDLKASGSTAEELKEQNFTCAELTDAGYSAYDLESAGYTFADLVAAGFTSISPINSTQMTYALTESQFTNVEVNADIKISSGLLVSSGLKQLSTTSAGGIVITKN
jgi:hypothetical protein